VKTKRREDFLPTTLFVFHADVIRDQLANDLENSISLPYGGIG